MNNFGNIKQIKSPELNSINFASSLDEVFANINYNFNQLANYDFIKGESGKSIDIIEVPFFNEQNEETELAKKLKACINDLGNTDNIIDDDNNIITVWDNFTPENAGSIYMIYNTENDTDINESKPLSSLQYIFLDGRFANKNVGNISNMSQYDNITDLSCIVIYDQSQDGFKALTNSLATLYYDSVTGLCWKINGMETGIPAKGIPGKDGKNSKIHIVKCNTIKSQGNFSVGEIVEILDLAEGFVPIKNYADTDDLIDTAVLILSPNPDSSENGSNFYFGTVYNENNILKAICDPSTSINDSLKTTEITNYFKNISLIKTDSVSAPGLFIPISNENNGVQPVHFMSASSVTNNEAVKKLENADFLFTPIADINSLTNINDNNNLLVNKYLYLKINDNSIVGNYIKSDSDFSELNTKLKENNYIVKYKLVDTVKDIDINFNKIDIKDGKISGSRFIKDSINTENLKYIYQDEGDDESNSEEILTTNDHISTIPASFLDRINNSLGIYRWEVYDNNYTTGNSLPFAVIFTTTITPAVSSEIMWFNGITPAQEVDDPNVLYGWGTPIIDNNIFNFVKFEPIYDNDFKYAGDAALNINYNINITGDEETPTHNINVHGDVNCDYLDAYNSISAGEFKNIYTKDIITSEAGIQIGSGADILHIDNQNIKANGTINANNININDKIVFNSTGSNKIDINNINELTLKRNKFGNSVIYTNVVVPNTPDNNYENNTNLTPPQDIPDLPTTESNIRVRDTSITLSTDIPTVYNNNSNIIVTNETSSKSDQLCYYDRYVKIGKSNPGEGVADSKDTKIKNVKFERTKNFNIHRLAARKYLNPVTKSASVSNYGYTSELTVYNASSWSKKLIYDKFINNISYKSNINNNDVPSESILKLTIPELDNNIDINRSEPIVFNIQQFLFQLGILGRCSNGRWPLLLNSSEIYYKLYYKRVNNNKEEYIYIKDIYDKADSPFQFALSNIIADDRNYVDKNMPANEWHGWGIYNGIETYLDKKYDEQWRYYTYILPKTSVAINVTDNEYYNIMDELYTNRTVDFYICPAFVLEATGEKYLGVEKKVIKGIGISNLIPFKYEFEDTSNISETVAELTTKKGGNIFNNIDSNIKNINKNSSTIYTDDYTEWGNYIQTNNVTYSYFDSGVDETISGVNSTTICEDGIVMRSGDFVFGIGYGKSFDHNTQKYVTEENSPTWKESDNPNIINKYVDGPMLFYHSYDPDYNINNENGTGLTAEDYAKRIHSIPLKDLFDVIRYIQEDTKFSEWQLTQSTQQNNSESTSESE